MTANLKGNNVSNATPSAGQTLTWDGSQWAPATPSGGGITQLTNDVLAGPGSGSQSTDVVQLTGQSVQGEPNVLCRSSLFMFGPDAGASSVLIRVGYGAPVPYGFNASAPVLSGRRDGYNFKAAIGPIPTDPAVPGQALTTFDINAGQTTLWSQGVPNIQTNANVNQNTGATVATVDVETAWVWRRVEQFTGNYLTDSAPGAGSLVLEALIPGGSGGATLTLNQSVNPYGGQRSGGRYFMVSDVLGTLDPANPLTVVDIQGRQFYVSGQAPSGTFVMDQQYQSATFRLTRFDPGSGAVEAWVVMRG